MEEEEAIRRITRLLEMGGTMLAAHHDCGAPLFRYKGDLVCPVCSFEDVKGAQPHPEAERPSLGTPAGPSGASASISGEERGEGRGTDYEGGVEREDEGGQKRGPGGGISHRERSSGDRGKKGPKDLAFEEMEAAILDKVGEISDKMRDEQDLGRLKSQLECLKEALEVLERLRGLGAASGSDRLG